MSRARDAARTVKRRSVEEAALAELELTARQLEKADARAHALMLKRDRLVNDARRQGVSWARVSAAAGVSAPALVQRLRRVTAARTG